MTPAYPVLTLRRSDLVARGACRGWLTIFDEICAMRGDARAPLVRRGTVSRRDPSRLRVELTPLAQVWLSMPLGTDGTAWAWLRSHGIVGPQWLRGADLGGADLYGADLSGADLYGADLSGADLSHARRWLDDPPVAGWALHDGVLVRGAR